MADNQNQKEKIFKIAEEYNIDKNKLYSNFKQEKKRIQSIYENSKSNLDEYKNSQNESLYGMQLCIQSKKKLLNKVELNYDKKFKTIIKKYDLQTKESEILYIIIKQISEDISIDFNADDIIKKYTLHVPDFGFTCRICFSPVNFITRQIRSADEGDKTFVVCTKDNNHIFSTSEYTLDPKEREDKESNILFDR